MSQTPYQQLESEFRRLSAFRGAASVLHWDASVMMPKGSADIRGEQLAALEVESHALLISPKVSRLLDRAEANAQSLDDWGLANLREMRRERDHAMATPQSLVARLAKATSHAEVVWVEAKQRKDFSAFAPHLEVVVQLVRERAQVLAKVLNLAPYDALVDSFSPGLTTAEIDKIFSALQRRLPGLVQQAIDNQQQRPAIELNEKISASKQRQLANEVMKTIGFNFERGRLDESEHPFTGGVPGDIRVTSRFAANDPLNGLMTVLHETGHAMYEINLPSHWRGQPVGRDRGMALHESQSLLLEMVIGRNRPMLNYIQPLMLKYFGVSGESWSIENLYRLLTRVQRSFIRMDADELTYPIHIMLRYELEQDVLQGKLLIKDLPEAWNALMESRLGIKPSHDGEGCLQDIHWAGGAFGYFPSYAIGAVIAAQLYEALRNDVPQLDDEIASGNFTSLFAWLKENVHGQASRVGTVDLIKNATGKALTGAAWLRYVEAKYLEE